MTIEKSRPPINGRFPLIVVRREYFDQFAAGTKDTEYRLHRPPFTRKAYYPGRWVRIAYNYNITKTPTLLACVIRFDVAPAYQHLEGDSLVVARTTFEQLRTIYPALEPDTELALIKLYVRRDETISTTRAAGSRP